jgi:hypothetical protein
LFDALRVPGVATEVQFYGAGPGLVEVMAAVAFVYSTLSAVKDTLGILESLRKWRGKARKKYTGTYVRIERLGHAPINLMTASDEELTLYIADGPDADEKTYEIGEES